MPRPVLLSFSKAQMACAPDIKTFTPVQFAETWLKLPASVQFFREAYRISEEETEDYLQSIVLALSLPVVHPMPFLSATQRQPPTSPSAPISWVRRTATSAVRSRRSARALILSVGGCCARRQRRPAHAHRVHCAAPQAAAFQGGARLVLRHDEFGAVPCAFHCQDRGRLGRPIPIDGERRGLLEGHEP